MIRHGVVKTSVIVGATPRGTRLCSGRPSCNQAPCTVACSFVPVSLLSKSNWPLTADEPPGVWWGRDRPRFDTRTHRRLTREWILQHVQPAILTLEDRLILLLARGRLPPLLAEEARSLLARPLRWDRVLQQARAQEVYPLVHRNLRALDPPGIPADFRAALDTLAKINALRNTLLAEELSSVLERLAGAGIPAAPLKGVTLAESLYGDRTLRVCADLDILVPREAVGRACDALLSGGYDHDEEPRVGAAEVDLLLRSNIEYAFVTSTRVLPCRLELHWDLVWRWPRGRAATDDLWGEARRGRFFGSPGYELSPEWQLLFLAAHLARHRWQGLKWLIDIHEVCVGPAIDWRTVGTKAARLGWEDMVALTLGACRALLDTPVPAGVPLRPPPGWLTLFPADPPPASPLTNALFPLRLFARCSRKLRYLAHLLFIPTLTESRALGLPRWLGFLYYLVRPARLVSKWGGELLRMGLRGLSGRISE